MTISEYLERIFFYHEGDYLHLFLNSMYFWLFFALLMGFYSFLYRKNFLRNSYLFLASLFFYYKVSGYFFWLLIISTVWDYTIGLGIYYLKPKWIKTTLVVLSITFNLLMLVYFKYAYFFTDSFNQVFGTDLNLDAHLGHWFYQSNGAPYASDPSRWLPPIGISFFTFQTISYSVDVYKGLLKPVKNIFDFGFYVSFFPQLVMGPIVRAANFIPQIKKNYSVSKEDFGLAIYWILKGLIKKILLADFLAGYFVDGVFADPLRNSGFENMMAVVGYSMQVYADFSGYTDMAIGIALLLGFRLMTNFNSPYKAVNVGEFWKRWHISLSSWLKDYLYIPLGGNRKGTIATYICLVIILATIVLISGLKILAYYFAGVTVVLGILFFMFQNVKKAINTNINLMITMLLGGLWHGASWNFVIWGGLNGLGIVVYKFWRRISPWENSNHWVARAWKILLTFSFITFTRIFFRSENIDIAKDMMHQIWYNMDLGVAMEVIKETSAFFIILAIGFILHWLPSSLKASIRLKFVSTPFVVKVLISVLVVLMLYQFNFGDAKPFIYFQF